MGNLPQPLPVDKTIARAMTAIVELGPPAAEGEAVTTTDLPLQVHITIPMIDGTVHGTISSSITRGAKTTVLLLPKITDMALPRRVIMEGLPLQIGPLPLPHPPEIPTTERRSGNSSVPSTKTEAASYQKLNYGLPW